MKKTIDFSKKKTEPKSTICLEKKKFKIYAVEKYVHWGKSDNALLKYDKDYEEYDLKNLIECLEENDFGYHLRIDPANKYIFFGDLDGYTMGIKRFITLLINFFDLHYKVKLKSEDIKYTKNIGDDTSYHFSIPKICCSIMKMKSIIANFRKLNENDFITKTEKGRKKYILDTSIYSVGFFRYPNQSKEMEDDTKHKIIFGKMADFIVEHIPKDCYNIENICVVQKNEEKDEEVRTNNNNNDVKVQNDVKVTNTIIENNIDKNNKIIEIENIIKKSVYYKQFHTYRQFFDKCYKKIRFDNYEEWIKIGMALKNIYNDEGFALFNYGSSKSGAYDGDEITKKKYMSFEYNYDKGYNIGTLYKIAKEDNRSEYIKILEENSLILTEFEFAEKIKELAGDRFLYKYNGDNNYQLYCFNGKYWTTSDILLRKFISTKLYQYYKDLINDVYFQSNEYHNYKNAVLSLKKLRMVKDTIERYKEFGVVDNIDFDNKWWLFGFNNIVYDLNSSKFREYSFDDYITITTGYDWVEPEISQIIKISSMLEKIMPVEKERNLLLILFATTLEGRPLERFIVMNGSGRNGKGCINDILLLALGNYGILANESILFEKSRTGSNPEKANLHKKRMVLFREPAEKSKFENSVIKILTGGGKFSARALYDNQTEKILHNTTFVECNKRPVFAEEPRIADIERLIDIYYRSTFTSDANLVDETNSVYLQDPNLKNPEFQHSHKCALLKILFDQHKKYKNNNYRFTIPETIKTRTSEYLEMSCDILQWFKDEYYVTEDKNDILKLKDIFDKFKDSEYYYNLTKSMKRKYNYRYFVNYFRENILLKRYYRERYHPKPKMDIKNAIIKWKKLIDECEKKLN